MTPVDHRQAFLDESFHEAPSGGFYVLAAAVFDAARYEFVRTAMREIRGKRNTSKLHWSEMDAQQRRNAVKTVADADGFYLTAVGAPVPRKRQERARAKCLQKLALELYGYGVSHLLVESRTAQLDRNDVATVVGVRFQLSRAAAIRVDHVAGAKEPLFWAADIVAGAVRADREGQSNYRLFLDGCVYEFDVATGCGYA